MKEIAVLLTCHNRKEKTIKCLKSLDKAINKFNNSTNFDIYLVDDGSTDGTSAEVAKNYAKVNLIQGSGNLFWAGGMRLAWDVALKEDKSYDYFLLLNDDVILYEDFLTHMQFTHNFSIKHFNQTGIYVSSTQEIKDKKISYGGLIIKNKGIKIKNELIEPSEVPKSCSMANGNILMVSMEVVNKIGIIDPNYIHRFADFDYTLAATKQGIPVMVCPEFGGICKKEKTRDWLPSGSSLKDRMTFLYSPLGLSYKERLYYLRKNFKYQFPYYFIMLWLKTMLPFLWDKVKKD